MFNWFKVATKEEIKDEVEDIISKCEVRTPNDLIIKTRYSYSSVKDMYGVEIYPDDYDVDNKLHIQFVTHIAINLGGCISGEFKTPNQCRDFANKTMAKLRNIYRKIVSRREAIPDDERINLDIEVLNEEAKED